MSLAGETSMNRKVTLGLDGRVSLPSELRETLGLAPGDDLLIDRVGDELRLLPVRAAVARARRLVRSFAPDDHSGDGEDGAIQPGMGHGD